MLRDDVIGALTEVDEDLSNELLTHDTMESIPQHIITNALRRATIRRQLLPVYCGSSYKNVGVQSLMDSILKLLPSPLETKRGFGKYYQDQFCGLAFKVIHDTNLGALTFIRIYSGEIKPLTKIYNVNRKTSEKVQKIYAAYANEYKEVGSCGRGNIAVVSGLNLSITGDTLVGSLDAATKVSNSSFDSQVLIVIFSRLASSMRWT